MRWITGTNPVTGLEKKDLTPSTDPLDKDTDGDGYWDGWIGVYGAEDSRDVVLYMHHLKDKDDTVKNSNGKTIYGVRGDEIVQSQIGIHDLDEAPSATGADIDQDGNKEHSNIHIGELQWKSDPTDGGSTPDTGFTVEVDYFNKSHPEVINTEEWEEGLENNMKLYGIGLEAVRSQVLTTTQLQNTPGVEPADNFTKQEIASIKDRFEDENLDTDLYYTMLTGRQDRPNVSGTNFEGFGNFASTFISAIKGGVNYSKEEKLSTRETTMHELGHSIDMGEADDYLYVENAFPPKIGTESYSGDTVGTPRDKTPEKIRWFGILAISDGETKDLGVTFRKPKKSDYPGYTELKISQYDTEDWSIMGRPDNFHDARFNNPVSGDYVSYSVEEVSTVVAK